MKKILSILLAVFMLAGVAAAFAGCSKSNDDNKNNDNDNSNAVSDLNYVTEKGKLIVGITEYEPMNYKDKATKEWTGFDTEFAQTVGQKLGVEVEFIEIDWDNKFFELDSKAIDCVWNGMTITDEALLNASVSDPYVKNAQVVVMKSSEVSKYTSIEDMGELTWAVEAGSAGEKALKENKLANATSVKTQADALMEVASGSVDACVIDITMANSMTGEGTSYKDLAQSISLEEEEYGIAFRKDSDLKDKVNDIMKEMKQDGSLKTIADKYELTLA